MERLCQTKNYNLSEYSENTCQVERCQENWAGRILCGGSFEQQLPQILESSFHQETCMPKKLKVKISAHDRNVYYINSKVDQLMNLNDLVEFNIQDLIEL